jgi:hypothetical protein
MPIFFFLSLFFLFLFFLFFPIFPLFFFSFLYFPSFLFIILSPVHHTSSTLFVHHASTNHPPPSAGLLQPVASSSPTGSPDARRAQLPRSHAPQHPPRSGRRPSLCHRPHPPWADTMLLRGTRRQHLRRRPDPPAQIPSPASSCTPPIPLPSPLGDPSGRRGVMAASSPPRRRAGASPSSARLLRSPWGQISDLRPRTSDGAGGAGIFRSVSEEAL